MKRSSGVIMHISSLPEKYGIGTFGKQAYKFANFLEQAGQTYWQILPLGHTGYGDSPYQCFSAFAGNPYFIDLELLVEDELLEIEDLENVNFGDNSELVDYGTLFEERFKVLNIAYQNSKGIIEMDDFIEQEKLWLEDYALYMAIKEKMNLAPLKDWDKDIKFRKKSTLDKLKKELKDRIGFWEFVQYQFFKQWNELKSYVNSLGIKIIGDIPIYVAEDSADMWANPNMFKIGKDGNPTVVAGCPPDAFSATGQLWGNPIYDWEYLHKTGYEWWIDRIKGSLKLFDVIRIDHFRGFEAYWEVPATDKTAVNGKWVPGPKMKLFNKIKEELGELNIIAEDLGYITPELGVFLKEAGYPGMKILEFAFSPNDPSTFLPYFYDRNCIVYTGTHDNDTLCGWIETTGDKKEIAHCMKYLNVSDIDNLHWDIIRCAWASVANVAIAQMQDFLGLGNKTRMNFPSTLGGNWQWRMLEGVATDELAAKIKDLTKLYGRDKGNPDVYQWHFSRVGLLGSRVVQPKKLCRCCSK